MPLEDDAELRRLGTDAVSDLISKIDQGAMATRFALLIEVVDAEGERGLWAISPDGQKAWDTLGLLQYAIQLEQAASVRDE
jgi:hypothetical protein